MSNFAPAVRATGNRILDALPVQERAALAPHLTSQRLTYKQVVFDVGDRIDHIYFPVDSVISLVVPLVDGTAVEVGTVGNEGLVGLALFLGSETSPREAVAQGAGNAWRLHAEVAMKQFRLGLQFHGFVLKYIEIYLEQVAQTAVCNARHDVAARCARWLLMMADKIGRDDYPITQDFLAMLLGVRRTGINAAISELKQAGIINYTRGMIRISHRDKLEALACECHATMKQRIEGFLR